MPIAAINVALSGPAPSGPTAAPYYAVQREVAPANAPKQLNIVDMERRMVVSALESTQGNVTRAAALLGLTRDTLRYRIEKYHIRITH